MPKNKPTPRRTSATSRHANRVAGRAGRKPRRVESTGDRLLRETMDYKMEMKDRFAPGTRKNP